MPANPSPLEINVDTQMADFPFLLVVEQMLVVSHGWEEELEVGVRDRSVEPEVIDELVFERK